MIHIDSAGGRIGRIWWFNSDPTPRRVMVPVAGFMVTMELEQWGTFGFGGQVTPDWVPRSYEPACGTGGRPGRPMITAVTGPTDRDGDREWLAGCLRVGVSGVKRCSGGHAMKDNGQLKMRLEQ